MYKSIASIYDDELSSIMKEARSLRRKKKKKAKTIKLAVVKERTTKRAKFSKLTLTALAKYRAAKERLKEDVEASRLDYQRL